MCVYACACVSLYPLPGHACACSRTGALVFWQVCMRVCVGGGCVRARVRACVCVMCVRAYL